MSLKIRLVRVATADEFDSPVLRSRAGKAPNIPTARLLRAMSGAEEVALVVLDVHEGAPCAILYEIFLCSELRNRGVGTRVLAALAEHVRASGKTCLEVWPRTLDRANRSDAQLVRWYTRHGFVRAEGSSERLRRVLVPPDRAPRE